MKYGLLLIVFLVCGPAFGFSDHNNPNPTKRLVECRIVDAATGEALTGVQVAIEGTELVAWTDAEGKCAIELNNDTNPIIICKLVSFETTSLSLSELKEEAVIHLHEK